jgi:hypothetical protein
MTVRIVPPSLDRYDVAVDEAIATCGGDAHGALKALIIANEGVLVVVRLSYVSGPDP